MGGVAEVPTASWIGSNLRTRKFANLHIRLMPSHWHPGAVEKCRTKNRIVSVQMALVEHVYGGGTGTPLDESFAPVSATTNAYAENPEEG
jgi:hypothetical protein